MGVSLLASETSLVGKRGAFARHALWVTPHSDDEKWPAGNYTVQSSGGEGITSNQFSNQSECGFQFSLVFKKKFFLVAGLEKWTANDRSILEEDVVLWHTFGVTHIPRTEDFPVMPVISIVCVIWSIDGKYT